jgi:nucleotide-binding universal stress UspA family protein
MPTPQVSPRLSFSNVLFPTDFSSASEAALPYVKALSRYYEAKIFVTHAVTPPTPIFMPMEPVPLDLDGEWRNSQKLLTRFLNRDPLRATASRGVLERGDLWNVIEDVVQRHSIDLIVLGTHGKHGLKKLVLGSRAERIFRQASCPVLTIGPRVTPPTNDDVAFKCILFATDFSAGSLRALPYALSLAEENQARLILLHVIPLVPLQHQDSVAASARGRLEVLVPPESSNWCRRSAWCVSSFRRKGS